MMSLSAVAIRISLVTVKPAFKFFQVQKFQNIHNFPTLLTSHRNNTSVKRVGLLLVARVSYCSREIMQPFAKKF